MNHSEQLNELATALAKAQGSIKSAVKGKENPFFKSQYADLPAVMEACRKALSDNGLALSQVTEFDGADCWLETMLIHSSGQWLRGRYPVRPVKNDPQGLGSAQTYARRYALMAMVGVVAENEDDDANAASGHPKTNGNGKADMPVDEYQLNNLRDLLEKTHSDIEAFCAYAKVKALGEIKQRDYPNLVMVLNTKERKRA